jgi:hypothetical protein
MFPRLVVVLSQTVLLACVAGCGGRSEKGGGSFEGPFEPPGELRDAGVDAPHAGFDASDARPRPAECKQTPGNIGQFLFTMALKPFPTKPNLMRTAIEILGDGSMIWTSQFFDYDRTHLVGAPVVAGPFPLLTDGSFHIDRLILEIPGEALCALPDTAVSIEMSFNGASICDQTNFACGTMNGVVLGLGVDLNGSTFTLQALANGMIPEPVTSCDRAGRVENCK